MIREPFRSIRHSAVKHSIPLFVLQAQLARYPPSVHLLGHRHSFIEVGVWDSLIIQQFSREEQQD